MRQGRTNMARNDSTQEEIELWFLSRRFYSVQKERKYNDAEQK